MSEQIGPGDHQQLDSERRKAEDAVRDALGQVEQVLARARQHVAEIERIEAEARADQQRSAGGAEPQALQPQDWSTQVSLNVVTDYLRHFFELVSMQNRMVERRLESLEHIVLRMEQHVVEQVAETTARQATLDGVQLPLVRPSRVEAQNGQSPTVETPPAVETVDAAPGVDEVEAPFGPDASPGPDAAPEPVGAHRNAPSSLDIASATPPAAESTPLQEWTARPPSPETAPPRPVGPTILEEGPANTIPRFSRAPGERESGSAASPAGYDWGTPVEGVISIEGLATFRMLAAVREGLKSGGNVLSAEPTSFEAGRAQLRVRAVRPLAADELADSLSRATGQDVEALGPMSFRVGAAEPSPA